MNYGDLQAAVYAYLNRSNISDGDFAAMTSVAHGKIQRVLKDHPRNIVRAAFTQTANDAFLPLPTNLLQVIAVYQDNVQLIQYPAGARSLAALKGGYVDKGACLELFPTPLVDTDYRLDYYSMVPPLDSTEEDSTNWVLAYYPDIYVYAILAEAAIFYRDDTRAPIWTQEFVQRVSELLDQGWGQNLSTLPDIKIC